jgi:hypothetical protein
VSHARFSNGFTQFSKVAFETSDSETETRNLKISMVMLNCPFREYAAPSGKALLSSWTVVSKMESDEKI